MRQLVSFNFPPSLFTSLYDCKEAQALHRKYQLVLVLFLKSALHRGREKKQQPNDKQQSRNHKTADGNPATLFLSNIKISLN